MRQCAGDERFPPVYLAGSSVPHLKPAQLLCHRHVDGCEGLLLGLKGCFDVLQVGEPGQGRLAAGTATGMAAWNCWLGMPAASRWLCQTCMRYMALLQRQMEPLTLTLSPPTRDLPDMRPVSSEFCRRNCVNYIREKQAPNQRRLS